VGLASADTATSGANLPGRISDVMVAWLASSAARATSSGSAAGWSVAMARSQAWRPLGARGLVAVLLDIHAGDHLLGVLEGLLERVDEVHPSSRSM
jgi:hypothetical protein